jgi:hypothetical protein
MTAIEKAYEVLKQHHYEDWKIVVTKSGGALCMLNLKEIWIDEHSKDDIFLLLHEIAHIKYPEHDRLWADRFTCLCQRHMGWAIPLANWSDEITLAMPLDIPRMGRLKKEWIDQFCDWPYYNEAPEYTKNHYEPVLDMVADQGGE